MSSNRFRDLILPGLLIAVGLVLRVRQWWCFEFKDDQARSILNSLCALREAFLIPHGMAGSTGFPNPPGANVIFGALSVFGTSPGYFAGWFVFFSVLTVGMAWLVFRRTLETEAALWGTAFLAAMPMLVWNSSNFWGPNLLPLMMLGILYCLTRFWESGHGRYWFGAGFLAVAAGWAWHLSGFFLLPFIGWLGWRRKVRLRVWVGLGAATLALLGPWLYFLIFRWDGEMLKTTVPFGEKIAAWIFHNFGWCGTLFFRDYFPPGELGAAAAAVAGAPWFGWVLLLGGALIFWGAVAAVFVPPLKPEEKAPVMISLALGFGLTVPLLYLLLGLRIHFHYLTVLAPAAAAIAGFGMARMPRKLRLVCGTAGLGCMLLLTALFQQEMLRGGGHPYEFGPSGNYLTAVAAELDAVAAGRPLSLKIIPETPAAGRKLDPVAALYIFDRHMVPDGIPAVLVIGWDEHGRCFRHRLLLPEGVRPAL